MRDVAPEGEHVAAFAHGDGEPDAVFSVDAEHRLRRVGRAARDMRDVAEADNSAVLGDEVDRENVLRSDRNAPETRTRIFSSSSLHDARGGDGVLSLECGDQREAD